MPQFGYNQDDDPLGIGLQERARQRREQLQQQGQENAAAHGQLVDFSRPSLPMSPSMEGLFQSLHERGVDKLGDNSVGALKGMWGQSKPLTTADPTFQQTSIGSSTNIGAPHSQFANTPPPPHAGGPIDGLYSAADAFRTPRKPPYGGA